jgi:hypothetical protein
MYMKSKSLLDGLGFLLVGMSRLLNSEVLLFLGIGIGVCAFVGEFWRGWKKGLSFAYFFVLSFICLYSSLLGTAAAWLCVTVGVVDILRGVLAVFKHYNSRS